MAQTTGATSARNAVIEVSTNGSSWTDISGFANSVDPGESTRMLGEVYTFDGDTAIITAGKRQPLDLDLKFVYTEGGSEVFEVVRAAHEAGTNLYVRYTVKAASTGNFRYTSAAGLIGSFKYPAVDSEDPKSVICGFSLKVPSLTKAAIP